MKRVGFTIAILGVFACATPDRSEQARAPEPEYPKSYYNRGEKDETITQRLAMMGQPKKRVVVLNFWNHTPAQYPGLGTFAADELRRGLFLTERVILPIDLQNRLETENFVQGEKIKVAQLIREGRRMGVAVLVLGRISRVVFRQRGDDVGLLRHKQSLAGVDVEMKVFDVSGGREILAVSQSGESSSNSVIAFEDQDLTNEKFRGELVKLALRDAVGKLTGSVMAGIEKLSWQGRVAKIVGTKVYVSAGRSSGLVPGDILRVITEGEEVYDPVTGAYLGKASGQLKGTLEVVDFIGQDGAVANVHTGGQFQEGDLVQLY